MTDFLDNLVKDVQKHYTNIDNFNKDILNNIDKTNKELLTNLGKTNEEVMNNLMKLLNINQQSKSPKQPTCMYSSTIHSKSYNPYND
jgi:mevalonate kinase